MNATTGNFENLFVNGTRPVLSVSATSPIASTGGPNPVLSLLAPGPATVTYIFPSSCSVDADGRTVTCVNGTQPLVSSGMYSIDQNVLPVCNSSSCGFELSPNVSVGCWLGVGNSNPLNQNCGDATVSGILTVGVDHGPVSGDITLQVTRTMSAVGPSGTTDNYIVFKSFISPGTTLPTPNSNTYRPLQNLVTVNSSYDLNPGQVFGFFNQLVYTGNVSQTGTSVTALVASYLNVRLGTSPASVNIASLTGEYAFYQGVGGSSSSIASLRMYYKDVPSLGSTTITTLYGSDTIASVSLPSTATVYGHSVGAQSGATKSAAYWINSNTANCGSGNVYGASMDTCQYRCNGVANCLQDQGARWIGTYGAVGATTTPSKTTTGDWTAIRLWQGTLSAPNQVIDTTTCTGSLTCTKTNNAVAFTGTGVTSCSSTGGGTCSVASNVLTVNFPTAGSFQYITYTSGLTATVSLGTGAGTGATSTFTINKGGAFKWFVVTGTVTAAGTIATFTPGITCTSPAGNMAAHMNIESGSGPVYDGYAKGIMVQYATSPTTFSIVSTTALTSTNAYNFFFTVYCL